MLYFELYSLFSFTCKYKLGQLWCKLEHSLKSSLDIFDFYFISGSFSASPVSLGTTTNRINLSCFFSFFMFGNNVISYKTHYICSSSIIQILCTCSIKNIILLNFILIIICALLIFLVQVHGLNKVVYNCIYYFWWCHQAITT